MGADHHNSAVKPDFSGDNRNSSEGASDVVAKLSIPSSPFSSPEIKPDDDSNPPSVENVPGEILADLLDGVDVPTDPSQRDYGSRYRFQGILGEGGQGVVVAAEDSVLHRTVAIKALKKPMDRVREEHLQREAELCGGLEHPNILPTYDLAEDETGSPLLVMRKISGRTLDELLKDAYRDSVHGGRTMRLHFINIFLQVCNAVGYAHSRGVLHCDIKPGNVTVGSFGEVYLLDWGFAARMDEKAKIVAGTPIYIAPERFSRADPDVRCDVYSLGVMLYRILTNRHPREVGKMTFREYRETFRNIPVIPPHERDRSIPADLEAIVMKAMSDDADDRYPTVRALAEDVERFLSIQPVMAYAENPFSLLIKFLRRHKRLAITMTMVFLIGGIAAFSIWKNHQLELRAQRQAAVEQERKLALQKQAQARIPLEKAREMVEQNREAIERETDNGRRREILVPAMRLFDEALHIKPDFADALYERGKVHYLARNMDNALADFHEAYFFDSSLLMAHYYSGRIYMNNQDLDRARTEFEAMKEVDPNNEYSELGQAYIALTLKKYEEALVACDMVESISPALSDVWYIRGKVYQVSPELKDLKKAQIAYDIFLDSRRDSPSAFLNRGDVRNQLGDYDGAVKDYTEALNVSPDYIWALNNRGYLLYRFFNKPDLGLQDCERALRIKPDDFWSRMNRAAIFEGMQRYPDAYEDYRYLLKTHPSDMHLLLRLGEYHFRQLQFSEAEAMYDRAIALMGNDSDNAYRALYCRGVCRLAQANYAAAIRDLEDSLHRRTQGHAYPALMRWIAMKSVGIPIDEAEFAKQISKQADAPDDKPWLQAIGNVYLGKMAPAEALALATTEQALCETSFYLGAYEMVSGDKGLAKQYLEQTLSTNVHLFLEYTLAKRFLQALERSDDEE